MNVERVLEIENCHFATIIVKIIPGKSHKWMLNLGGHFNEEQNKNGPKCFPPDCLLILRRIIITIQWSNCTP